MFSELVSCKKKNHRYIPGCSAAEQSLVNGASEHETLILFPVPFVFLSPPPPPPPDETLRAGVSSARGE